MKLRKSDVERLLTAAAGDVDGAVSGLRAALQRVLGQPADASFDQLVDACGFAPERAAALHRRDPDALWDLIAELNECRQLERGA